MPRVPVPDDYESGTILVAGEKDFHYDGADVQVEDDRARTLHVREDDEGRYVGPPEQYASAVAEFLGVDWTEDDPDAPSNDGDEDATADDSGYDYREYEERKAIEEGIERGECPWCDDYTGDGVPQHASSAHPDEWSDYKEASEE